MKINIRQTKEGVWEKYKNFILPITTIYIVYTFVDYILYSQNAERIFDDLSEDRLSYWNLVESHFSEFYCVTLVNFSLLFILYRYHKNRGIDSLFVYGIFGLAILDSLLHVMWNVRAKFLWFTSSSISMVKEYGGIHQLFDLSMTCLKAALLIHILIYYKAQNSRQNLNYLSLFPFRSNASLYVFCFFIGLFLFSFWLPWVSFYSDDMVIGFTYYSYEIYRLVLFPLIPYVLCVTAILLFLNNYHKERRVFLGITYVISIILMYGMLDFALSKTQYVYVGIYLHFFSFLSLFSIVIYNSWRKLS